MSKNTPPNEKKLANELGESSGTVQSGTHQDDGAVAQKALF